jgi:hypothetical protein
MAVSALPSQEGRSSVRSSGLMRGTVRWYGMETGGPDGSLGDPPGVLGGPKGGCPPGNPTMGGLGTPREPPPPPPPPPYPPPPPPGPYPPLKGGSGGFTARIIPARKRIKSGVLPAQFGGVRSKCGGDWRVKVC